ncbi:MAG: nuclear transport factor 2 family protein [Ilumatobacteraceae bacterium]
MSVDPEVAERLADALIAAITNTDLDALRQIYADDVVIWHNFDQVEQRLDDNLKVMHWMAKRMPDKRYEDIRRQVTPTGYVQQHVLRGTAPDGTKVEMPACLIVTIEGERITRLDEYLDPAAAAPLSR